MAGTPAPPFLVPLEELRQRLAEAERGGGAGSRAEIARLRAQLEDEARRVTENLTPVAAVPAGTTPRPSLLP